MHARWRRSRDRKTWLDAPVPDGPTWLCKSTPTQPRYGEGYSRYTGNHATWTTTSHESVGRREHSLLVRTASPIWLPSAFPLEVRWSAQQATYSSVTFPRIGRNTVNLCPELMSTFWDSRVDGPGPGPPPPGLPPPPLPRAYFVRHNGQFRRLTRSARLTMAAPLPLYLTY